MTGGTIILAMGWKLREIRLRYFLHPLESRALSLWEEPKTPKGCKYQVSMLVPTGSMIPLVPGQRAGPGYLRWRSHP